MTDSRVRRYRPGDADRVRELHAAALRDAGTDPEDVPGTDDLDRIESAYLDDGEFVIAEADGEVVAMGGLRPAGDGRGELKRMRVDPEHQGSGYGRAILDALEEAAREQGFETVVAETAARQGSASFYRAAGYREVGRRGWEGYELIALEKDLDDGP